MRREVRRQHVKRRVTAPPVEGKCIVLGCASPTQRASSSGLSVTFCKKHKEFLRRHGSTWRKSYSMSELRPYLKAASKWTKANENRQDVEHTLRCLKVFLDTQGEPVDGREIQGLKPKRKAASTLARFREAKGERELFVIALALEALVHEAGPRGPEWIHTQIAKRVHRVEAGTHPVTSGGVKLPPKFPKAEGKKMRLIGEWVRTECRVFDLEGAVEEVIQMATTG